MHARVVQATDRFAAFESLQIATGIGGIQSILSGCTRGASLNVDFSFQSVLLNELPTRFNNIAHQAREHVARF